MIGSWTPIGPPQLQSEVDSGRIGQRITGMQTGMRQPKPVAGQPAFDRTQPLKGHMLEEMRAHGDRAGGYGGGMSREQQILRDSSQRIKRPTDENLPRSGCVFVAFGKKFEDALG